MLYNTNPCSHAVFIRNHLLEWFFFPAREGKPWKSLQSSSQEDLWAHFPKHTDFLVGGLGELPCKILKPLTQKGDAVHPIQTHSLALNYCFSPCGEPGILHRPPYFRNAMSHFHTHGEDAPKPFQLWHLQEPVRTRTLYKACVIGVTNHPSSVGTQGFLEWSKLVCSGWFNPHNTQLCGKGASPSPLLIRESELGPSQGLPKKQNWGLQ